MLSIGEFSGLTGLSVKALRHYDEKGVLVPAEVDAQTGYRRYGEEQVREGVIIRALRDADVPLPDLVSDGSRALSTLSAQRTAVLEKRKLEDAAFANAELTLNALAAPVTVEQRRRAEQPFAGRIISLPFDEADELTDEDANAAFAELFELLQESGAGPSGSFWTAMRSRGSDRLELVCCWPTQAPLPASWGGAETEVGALPERTELVATWSSTPGAPLPEGTVHPAMVALLDELAEHDIDLRRTELRQHVIGMSEDDYAVEVCVTVS